MTSGKGAAAGASSSPKPPLGAEQTPFERFIAFARRIVAVPKAELDKQRRRAPQRNRGRR